MDSQIYFIKEHPIYGCFSNFSPYEVEIDGITYQTSEHYYQAMKTLDETAREEIRNAPSPKIARQLGRKALLREDFDGVKNDIMRTVLKAKFTQHPNLHEILLDTGEEELIEQAPWDSYWGGGPDNK